MTFLENYWLYGLLIVVTYFVYRSGRYVFSFKQNRPMHWSSILTATGLVCYGGVALILRHPYYHVWGLSFWGLSVLISSLLSFVKAMKTHIQLNEKKQILVPSFFFKFAFCIIVPYSASSFFIWHFQPQLYDNFIWVVISSMYKGVIAGVYLGACVASIYQVYERDMPS